MSEQIPVNPKMLLWDRETSGYNVIKEFTLRINNADLS